MRLVIGKLIAKTFLVIAGISFLYPLLWMILMSFKTPQDVFNNPFGLPVKFILTNYPDAIKSSHFFRYFSNSAIYSAGTVIVALVLACPFAYCTSRMSWKYSKAAMSYVTMGLIIPVQVVIIPLFMLLKTLNIRNTYLGLILPYAAFALASGTLMLYAFFRSLPDELEEAAYIDGCNIYKSFFRIVLPMVKPAIVTQIVIIFMNTWNEFFMAFLLTNSDKIRPLTVGLLNFFVSIGTTEWGLIGAAMVISSLPTILIYLVFSEQIENALTAGAILK